MAQFVLDDFQLDCPPVTGNRPLLLFLKKWRSLFGDGEGDRSFFTSHIAQINCFSSSFLLTISERFYHGILACCQSFHP
ncbi:MAG: hypothetical protein WAN66_22645 [Limnoraphis robusta]